MSLLLLPQHVEPTLGVAWTLGHEMLFYVAFGVLIMSRAAGVGLFAVWGCFIAAVTLLAPSHDLPWMNTDLLTGFVGSSYNLEFGLGIAVAILARRYRAPFPLALVAAGLTGLLLAGGAEDANKIIYLGRVGQALFGVSSALLLLGLVSAERSGALRAGRFLVFLGAASYSIYLVHVPVMMGVGGLKMLPPWIAVPALTAIGIGAGVVLHVTVERPMLRVLSGLPVGHPIGRWGGRWFPGKWLGVVR